jgi:hypothetical protein
MMGMYLSSNPYPYTPAYGSSVPSAPSPGGYPASSVNQLSGQSSSGTLASRPSNRGATQNPLRNTVLGAGIGAGLGLAVATLQAGKTDDTPQVSKRMNVLKPHEFYDAEQDKTYLVQARQNASGELELDSVRKFEGKNKDAAIARIEYGRDVYSPAEAPWSKTTPKKNKQALVSFEGGLQGEYYHHNGKLNLHSIILPNEQKTRVSTEQATALVNHLPSLEDQINNLLQKEPPDRSKQTLKQRMAGLFSNLNAADRKQLNALRQLHSLQAELSEEGLKQLKKLVDTQSLIHLPEDNKLLSQAPTVVASKSMTWAEWGKSAMKKGGIGLAIGGVAALAATLASKTLVAPNPAKNLQPGTIPQPYPPQSTVGVS